MNKLIDAILIVGFLVVLITAIIENLPLIRQIFRIIFNSENIFLF